jgi:hypothetical protein
MKIKFNYANNVFNSTFALKSSSDIEHVKMYFIAVELYRALFKQKAQGGVVYGQYTTAKGYSYTGHNVECLDTALSRSILAIYHKHPRCLICYYKLVTNVIRAVKIYFWYMV